MVPFNQGLNTIVQGDCVEKLAELRDGCVDLVFADPPFNIGYEYDVYEDRKEHRDYLAWSRTWISAVCRVLNESGSFWLAIGDEYAAELKIASQEIGFHCRSWVIWYYTFGVNCKNKFSRSHAHLIYFAKHPTRFTFNANDLENRIPSARQLVYADSRANPIGRLADDTWVLRPQDLADCFTSAEDTWYFPRVAGTFKERAGFHGCQMPEQLLGRIIRLCSNVGDLIVDPFSGSATTIAVAKKLGRQYLGIELSHEYVNRGRARLDTICVGDPLDGSPEPTMSAPQTPKSGPKGSRGQKIAAGKTDMANGDPRSSQELKIFQRGLLEAYRRSYGGYSLDRVVADPDLNQKLADACEKNGLPGDLRSWNRTLLRLRKAGFFAELPTLHRTEFSWKECDPYLFASEIAWRHMIDEGCDSLDTILCDPSVASAFDEIARRWAPGFGSLEYRWAALKLRKSAKDVRSRAKLLADGRLSRSVDLNGSRRKQLPEASGIYVVISAEQQPVYVGEATNIRERIRNQFGPHTKKMWKTFGEALAAKYFLTSCPHSTRLAHQRRLIDRHEPFLNLPDRILHEGQRAVGF